MSTSCDVLILGGGVIGLTTAWYLAGEGARVRLVERGELGRQASWAGAGILPATQSGQAASPVDRLRALSGQLYPELSAQLLTLTGIDNGYRVCGGIELPDPAAPDVPLPTEEWHSPGVPFQHWDRQTLHQTAPYLANNIDRAVFLPTLAQVRNPRHLQALEIGCRQRGVELQPHCPVSLIRDGRRVRVEGAGSFATRNILVAAGAWSGQLLAPLGIDLPVRPVRGQILLYRTPREGIWPIVMQGKRYLVPRLDGRLLVGSTEEEAGFVAQTTPQGEASLRAFAESVMPSLADTPIERTWAGLRPGSPEEAPFLGAVPGVDNLHLACGHFRAGLHLSPATGWLLCQHLLGRKPSISLDAFALRSLHSAREV